MGKIYDEFCSHLKIIQKKYENNPDGELQELLLLALEREKLVSTAYRDSFLYGHISQLQVPDEYKTIFRHAFIWIWMDEEMHTTYTRGALLQARNVSFNWKVFSSQSAGLIGGWAGSVLQLGNWKKFPISYSIARVFTWVGTLSGKVPKEVKGELRSGTLKDFCAFNVDAEKTAWICWTRIVELILKEPKYPKEWISDFKKIIFDEHRHEQIFQIIHDELDEHDQLIPGSSIPVLVEKISRVSNYFLPKKYREADGKNNPVGTEGKVWSYYDAQHKGKSAAFHEFITATNLEEKIRKKTENLGKPVSELQIAIKVSFTMGYHHHDMSPVSDPALLDELVHWLRKKGIQHISVLDVQTLYGNFFKNRSVNEMADYFHFQSAGYQITDASQDHSDHQYSRGIGIYKISRSWRDADFRITFGKLKSHPMEMALLSIGNLEWLVGNCEDFIFLDKMSERPISTMTLLDEFPPDYALLDAYENIPIGLIGVMGCKRPVAPLRLYGSADALALDTVVMNHIGLKEFHQGSILKTVEYWFGGKYTTIEIVGEDTPIKEWKGPTDNYLWAFLSFLSNPIYLFFSQRGLLFIPKMDKQAFPEKKKTNGFIQLLRNINRRIIGLN